MVVRSKGSATITVADDSVVANATYKSDAKSVTFASPINSTTKGIGTISFDKTSYTIGEKATITVTVKNADGAIPGQVTVGGDTYAQADIFPTLVQNRAFSSIGYDAGGGNLGFGSSRSGTTFDISTGTFLNGVETYVVMMPTVAGDLTLTGFTTDGTYDTATAVSVTIKVVDPNSAAIAAAQAAANAATAAANAAKDAAVAAAAAAEAEAKKATAAAKAAQDAAVAEAAKATAAAKAAQDAAVAEAKKTADAAVAAADAAADAAAEAIDAANAATDAANLSAEAADAATVAAEEARDAADAATAAVEELATQVATLMAALKAQITTLANTVAKIAKKVKA